VNPNHVADRHGLVDAYEALRPSSSGRASLGQELLVQRGVAAWVGAWSTPATVPMRPAPLRPPSLHGASTPQMETTEQATRILVSMVLTHLQQTESHP
jgi:hypothetical protein